MSEGNDMIKVHVQRKFGSHPHPITLGQFRFPVLPRIGELVHVKDGSDELCLKVLAIDHYGYSDEETAWDGVITVTGEVAE